MNTIPSTNTSDSATDKPSKLRCERRTQYPSMEAAKEAVKHIKQHQAISYQCMWCNQFHNIFDN